MSAIKRLVIAASANEIFWNLCQKYLLKPAEFVKYARQKYLLRKNFPDLDEVFAYIAREQMFLNQWVKNPDAYSQYKNFCTKVASNLTVMNGPFSGMRYPEMSAAGSAILPKLIGSYEFELHPLISKIIKRNYSEVIDVGCAEGYYAVGLAMNMPETQVFAYDISLYAQALCREMAKLNLVDDRVFVQGGITSEMLKKFPFSHRSLVISDCEGYEAELFTYSNIEALSKCDLLIEVHERKCPNVTRYLTELFRETHVLEIVKSIDTLERIELCNYPEIEGFDAIAKYPILEERSGLQHWFFLQSKIYEDGNFSDRK